MTQFNLLPDIKLEYLRAERNRRIVISIAVLVTGVSILLAGTTFSITALQKHQIDGLNTDIRKQGSILSGQTNLKDIMTVQNQIDTLTTLHQQEPNVANLATYLNQTIPVTASLDTLTIDFSADSITMQGSADSLATVNQLVDSLKFATYKINGVKGSKNAFSDVVLTGFGVNQSATQGASFSISLNFDPALFNNTENVTLTCAAFPQAVLSYTFRQYLEAKA